MICKTCNSDLVGAVSAKCSDMCQVSIPKLDYETNDYVPSGLGIGDGDYLELDICFSCGQIQEEFPPALVRLALEKQQEELREEMDAWDAASDEDAVQAKKDYERDCSEWDGIGSW